MANGNGSTAAATDSRDSRVTLRQFDICVAMLPDRGIGKCGTISWPPISKDYQHYMKLTCHTDHPEKKCVNIKGRTTWDETGEAEKTRPNLINIVISETLRERPEHVDFVVNNFQAALELVSTSPLTNQVERVWVMGGQTVYQEALRSPYCHRIYLTTIFSNYDSDCYFPEFERDFRLIKVPGIEESMQEENGVHFKFDVYERIRH